MLNQEISHLTYGQGTIIEYTEQENYQDMIKVKFENDTKKFFARDLCNDKFFDTKFNEDITEKSLEMKNKYLTNKNRIEVITKQKQPKAKLYTKDEDNEIITLDKLYWALSVAGVEREEFESRPVVTGNDELFINASAACRSYELRIKDCDKIYKVCDGKAKTFMGIEWRYARRDEIQFYIDKYIEMEI